MCTQIKVTYLKYSKHWPYTVAHTIDCVCSKMLNYGLNYGLFLSLFKLIPCHIHCIVKKPARSAQTHKSISFTWIVWSTLYVYLWLVVKKGTFDENCAKCNTIWIVASRIVSLQGTVIAFTASTGGRWDSRLLNT